MTNNPLNITDDGLQDFESTTGDFTAIDLTTKGDLLAYTGTAYQRLPISTDGYVLKADSDVDVGLRWSCTGFEFIETQEASSSSTIEFNNFADAECYSVYKLVWKNVRRNAGELSFRLRFSIDNGVTWLTTNYKHMHESIRDVDGVHSFPYSASASYIEINSHTGDTSNLSFNGEAYFFTSATPSTTLKQGITFTSTNFGPTNSQFVNSRGYGLNTTNSTVDGFQFLMDSGTITSGTFSLYGVLV